jgi:ribosomal protein S4
MVSHSFFTINGKAVDVPSYEVKKNDLVSVKGNKKTKGSCFAVELPQVQTAQAWQLASSTGRKT